MTPAQKSNPSILDLQVAITDVEQLMLTYQQKHETYVTNLKAGLHTKSADSLATLKILNKQIETKLIYIQTASAGIKTKNALYGNGITTADGELDTIIGEIQKKNIVLQNLQTKQNFQRREMSTTKLLADSNYYHLVGFFIIYSIMAYFLVKMFTTETSGGAETIILILGASIFIYYFIEQTF
jgi:hypothetical protein